MLFRCAALAVLIAARAQAEPDRFWLGDGHHGALSAGVGTIAIVPAAPLQQDVTAGRTQLQTALQAAPGDLVMLVTSKGLALTPAAGDGGTISLTNDELGHYELGRVASVAGSQLTLSAPLERAFKAVRTQVVLVREYTDVTIAAGGAIAAAPWDGASGGVVAFLANGTLNLQGEISARAAGYRGAEDYSTLSSGSNCTVLEVLRPDAGLTQLSPRGEGAAFDAYPRVHGVGNFANAGGGGGCHEAGGGGGGHVAAGGVGGRDMGMVTSGGFGGAALFHVNGERLVFGGGGGAGEAHHAPDDTSGGAGGGVIFIRANHLVGSGRFDASGRTAANTSGDNGGGGGGAGGTIVLRIAGTTSAVSVLAEGGDGGSTRFDTGGNGPGGGGSGGAVFFIGASPSAAVSVLGGLAGICDIITGAPSERGATPAPAQRSQYDGIEKVLTTPAKPVFPPVFTSPAAGSFTAPRVTLAGNTAAIVAVRIRLDGVLLGSVFPDAGAFALDTPVLGLGAHSAEAQALDVLLASEWSAPHAFVVGTPQGAPVITTPREGEVLFDATPLIEVSTEPGDLVEVTLDSEKYGPSSALNGVLSLHAHAPLGDGPHVVYAEAVYLDGGRLTGPSVRFEVALPRKYDARCGCSEGGAGLALLLALSLASRRATSRAASKRCS